MSYGIKFNNLDNAKVLDGRHLLPQKIGTYRLDDYGYYTGQIGYNQGVNNNLSGNGPQADYILRDYNFSVNTGGRPYIVYWEFPEYGANDVWFSPGEYRPQVLYHKTVNPAVIGSPRAHVFALDYVSRSNASFGLRAWNPDNGALIYDSGNQHLAIYEIFTIGVDTGLAQNAPNATIQSYGSPHNYWPWGNPGVSGPAFTLPNTPGYAQYTVGTSKNPSRYEFTYGFFYRCFNATIQTRCMRTGMSFAGNEEGSSYYPFVSGANLSVSNIYGSRYA